MTEQHTDVVRRLRELLDDEPPLRSQLEQSMQQARTQAQAQLDRDLYNALQWPSTIDEYATYLNDFVRCDSHGSPPHRRGRAGRPDTVKHRRSVTVWHIFSGLSINLAATLVEAIESSKAFGDWLTLFARQWGSFLDTPESFNDEILRSFIDDSPEYNVGDSMAGGRPNMPSGWMTFNQFFARELNSDLDRLATHTTTPPSFRQLSATSKAATRSTINQAFPRQRSRRHTPTATLPSSAKKASRHADAVAGGTFVHHAAAVGMPPLSWSSRGHCRRDVHHHRAGLHGGRPRQPSICLQRRRLHRIRVLPDPGRHHHRHVHIPSWRRWHHRCRRSGDVARRQSCSPRPKASRRGKKAASLAATSIRRLRHHCPVPTRIDATLTPTPPPGTWEPLSPPATAKPVTQRCSHTLGSGASWANTTMNYLCRYQAQNTTRICPRRRRFQPEGH